MVCACVCVCATTCVCVYGWQRCLCACVSVTMLYVAALRVTCEGVASHLPHKSKTAWGTRTSCKEQVANNFGLEKTSIHGYWGNSFWISIRLGSPIASLKLTQPQPCQLRAGLCWLTPSCKRCHAIDAAIKFCSQPTTFLNALIGPSLTQRPAKDRILGSCAALLHGRTATSRHKLNLIEPCCIAVRCAAGARSLCGGEQLDWLSRLCVSCMPMGAYAEAVGRAMSSKQYLIMSWFNFGAFPHFWLAKKACVQSIWNEAPALTVNEPTLFGENTEPADICQGQTDTMPSQKNEEEGWNLSQQWRLKGRPIKTISARPLIFMWTTAARSSIISRELCEAASEIAGWLLRLRLWRSFPIIWKIKFSRGRRCWEGQLSKERVEVKILPFKLKWMECHYLDDGGTWDQVGPQPYSQAFSCWGLKDKSMTHAGVLPAPKVQAGRNFEQACQDLRN